MKREKFFNAKVENNGRFDRVIVPERTPGSALYADDSSINKSVTIDSSNAPNCIYTKEFDGLHNVIGFICEVSFNQKVPVPNVHKVRHSIFVEDAFLNSYFEDQDYNVAVDYERAVKERKVNLFLPLAKTDGKNSNSSITAFMIPNLKMSPISGVVQVYLNTGSYSSDDYKVQIHAVFHQSRNFSKQVLKSLDRILDIEEEMIEDGIFEEQ